MPCPTCGGFVTDEECDQAQREVDEIVRAAVAAERERWAKLAEEVGDEEPDALAVNCGYEIARRIRAEPAPGR